MKDIINIITIVFIGLLVVIGITLTIDSIFTYEVPAVIEEINPVTDWATLVDWQGEAWHCEQEGLAVGQIVMVEFDNMGTEDIYDDEIIAVRVG